MEETETNTNNDDIDIDSDSNGYFENEPAFVVLNEEALKKAEKLKRQTFPDVMVHAYIPSVEEYDKYFFKYRAYMGAFVPNNAEEELIKWRNNPNDAYAYKRFYFLRTPKFAPSGYPQIALALDNSVRCWAGTSDNTAGLRVAFRLVYDPKSKIVKKARMVKQTTCVYECKKQPEVSSGGKQILVTSEAPIIKFAEKECIWLNKEECEKGYSTTMECWGLYLLVTAKTIAKPWEHNDFAKSELREQCEQYLLQNCKSKEKKLLVRVAMNYKDGYEKVTPLFTEKQKMIIDKVKNYSNKF